MRTHRCFYKLILPFELIPVCFSPGSSAHHIQFECLHREFCFLLSRQLHCLFFLRPGQVKLLERSTREAWRSNTGLIKAQYYYMTHMKIILCVFSGCIETVSVRSSAAQICLLGDQTGIKCWPLVEIAGENDIAITAKLQDVENMFTESVNSSLFI